MAISVTGLAGWELLGSAPASGSARAAYESSHAAAAGSTLGSLERQLQRYLAASPPLPQTPPALPPRGLSIPRLGPGGGICYVATGHCSAIPCIEFAGASAAPTSGTATGVVLRLGETVNRNAPRLAQGSCEGRLGTPKVFRVSGP
jgi:hypothetical protein